MSDLIVNLHESRPLTPKSITQSLTISETYKGSVDSVRGPPGGDPVSRHSASSWLHLVMQMNEHHGNQASSPRQ